MSRRFRPLRAFARASLPAYLALLVASTAAAQAPSPGASTATPAAAAEQPRKKRDRRRAAEAAEAAAPAASVAAVRQAANSEDEIICKDIKPLGSRIPRRICGTEAQWGGSSEQTAAHAQEQLRQIRDRAALTGGSSSGPSSITAPARF